MSHTSPAGEPTASVAPFVFISYSHAQENEISKIVGFLKQNEIDLWFDRGISSGDEWLQKISIKLGDSDIFLLCVSKKALQSNWVRKECAMAITRNTNEGYPIILFRLEKCEYPKELKFLEQYQEVNANSVNWEKDLHLLLSALKNNLRWVRAEDSAPPKPMSAPQRIVSDIYEGSVSTFNTLVKNPTKQVYRWLRVPLVIAFGLCVLSGVSYYSFIKKPATSSALEPKQTPPDATFPSNPDPVPSQTHTHGIIEISRSGMKALSYRAIRNANKQLVLAERPDPTSSVDMNVKLRREQLEYKAIDKQFTDVSIIAVCNGTQELKSWLISEGVEERNIFVIISSGIASGIRNDVVVGFQKQLLSSLGNVVSIEIAKAENEAEYLHSGVMKKLGKPKTDNAFVIDVGSGNIKGTYYDPDGMYQSIYDPIPGTMTLSERAATKLTQNQRRTETVLERESYVQAMDVFASAEINLELAISRTPSIANPQLTPDVYLAGGSVWAMMRIARPDISLVANDSNRLIPINNISTAIRSTDIERFRQRTILEGDDILSDAPPSHASYATEFLRLLQINPKRETRSVELKRVMSRFKLEDRIAAGALLNRLSISLKLNDKKRNVYFYNDPDFEWLSNYLEQRLNAK